jgi:hypothetical protein
MTVPPTPAALGAAGCTIDLGGAGGEVRDEEGRDRYKRSRITLSAFVSVRILAVECGKADWLKSVEKT